MNPRYMSCVVCASLLCTVGNLVYGMNTPMDTRKDLTQALLPAGDSVTIEMVPAGDSLLSESSDASEGEVPEAKSFFKNWQRKLLGLATVNAVCAASWYYGDVSGSDALLFFAILTGRFVNDLTRDWSKKVRLLSVLLNSGAWATSKFALGFDVVMLRNTCLAWGGEFLSDWYAGVTGREHNVSKKFRRWKNPAKRFFIDVMKKGAIAAEKLDKALRQKHVADDAVSI